MTESADFLFELGTEELPPKALGRLSAALTEELLAGFTEAGLPFGAYHSYAAPRRMAVLVHDLAKTTPAQDVERRGPAVASAFDADGNPSRALVGFAKSCGVEIGELTQLDTDKGSWLVYRHTQKGRPAAEIIPAAIERALQSSRPRSGCAGARARPSSFARYIGRWCCTGQQSSTPRSWA